MARDPAPRAICGAEFLEAAEWTRTASIAAGRCTESESVAAADSLRAHPEVAEKLSESSYPGLTVAD